LQNYLHFHIVQLRSVEYKNIISFIQICQYIKPREITFSQKFIVHKIGKQREKPRDDNVVYSWQKFRSPSQVLRQRFLLALTITQTIKFIISV